MAEKKGKRYVSDNAQVMDEWGWEKNNSIGLDPKRVTYGSEKRHSGNVLTDTNGKQWCPTEIKDRVVHIVLEGMLPKV